jgi:hypothetical protein
MPRNFSEIVIGFAISLAYPNGEQQHGQNILLSVVFTSSPPSHTAVFGSQGHVCVCLSVELRFG